MPGRAERFANLETGEVISRRQYDKLYGRLAAQGLSSNEAQAKRNRKTEGAAQLLKPARGRSSARKLGEFERQVVAQAREEKRIEKVLQTKVERARSKNFKPPAKVTLRNFKPGRKGRSFRVNFDPSDIQATVEAARRYSGAFGYTVGVEFFDKRTGKTGAATLFDLRPVGEDFEDEDFEDIEAWADERTYLEVKAAFVYVALKESVYVKHAQKK